MTSLDKFLSYKKECPLCGGKLTLESKQGPNQNLKYRIEGNDIVINKTIAGWQMSKNKFSFNVEIRIDKFTNGFFVDFLERDGRAKDKISIKNIEQYHNYVKNKKETVTFRRSCTYCSDYYYVSNSFFFNYYVAQINPVLVTNEMFVMTRNINPKLYKIYYMQNDLLEKESKVSVFKREFGQACWIPQPADDSGTIVPLIDFTSQNKIMDKIDTITMFS